MRIKRANSWTPPHLYDEHWLAYIMQKTVPGPGGCILWTGHKSYNGYGMTSYHSKPVPVHRKILERKLGRPIKKGYHACHTCDVRNCLNADHLWEGSQTQNNKDMAAKGRYNYHRSHYTHCRNGHPLFGENMRITKQGFRACKTCQRIAGRRLAGWPKELWNLPPQPKGQRPETL